jgi:hypothetical protein
MVLPGDNASDPSGAYGFRLVLTEPETALPDLVSLSGAEESVTITCRLASATVTLQQVEDGRVSLLTRHGTGILVDRERLTVELLAPVPFSGPALVHPVLTIPLSILARWRGDVALHGGAFFHAGAAWGVIGERTAGKSSMLGVLGARGVPIVADDLLVIDDGWAHAGPRCVDLRPDIAPYLPAARDLGVVGTRPRFRLSTPAAPARAPLRGMFVLDWHDAEPELVPVATWERLKILYRQEAIALLGFAEPAAFVQLLEFPMWRLLRRRDWAATPAAVERLLAAAEDQARS